MAAKNVQAGLLFISRSKLLETIGDMVIVFSFPLFIEKVEIPDLVMCCVIPL